MTIPAFFKSKVFWIVLVIITAGSGYIWLKPVPQPKYTTVKVNYQNLTQTVAVTGSVRGATEVDLNFETTGRLDQLLVAKGDAVQMGQVLAQLSAKQINDAIAEATSVWQAARAELDKLLAGDSSEEIAVTEQKLKSAQVVLDLRNQELVDLSSQLVVDEKVSLDAVDSAERDLITARDNILRVMETELFDATTALDTVKDIFINTDKDDTLGVQDIAFKNYVANQIPVLEIVINNASIVLNQVKTSLTTSDINSASNQIYQALLQTADMLSDMNTVLELTPASSIYTQTTIDSDQSIIQSNHATISASISALQSSESVWETKLSASTIAANNLVSFYIQKTTQLNFAQGAVAVAKSEMVLVQAELDLQKTPARSEDISLQQARVSQYASALERVRADLDNVTLQAPFTGIITEISYNLGETTSMQEPVIKMIGESGLEVEVDIPESDIAKVQVGQLANITLDAFGDDLKFPGHVTSIDPAETLVQDVVYYKVIVIFDNDVVAAKPGMTANVDIITAEIHNILTVPARAVKQNGVKFVEVLLNDMVVKKEITTGLRGDGGLVEIISGLTADDDVITFVEESK